MADTTLRTIYSIDGKRRVRIVQRDNGHFSFDEEYFSDEPNEQCWLPYSYSRGSYADSEDIAIREACSRVDWLAQVLSNHAA
jgi:hypothetical protein